MLIQQFVPISGHSLSTESSGYQWERTRSWSSRYNEELWRSCCLLLQTSTHRAGSKVCFDLAYFDINV